MAEPSASRAEASAGTVGGFSGALAEWSSPLIDGKPPPARGGQAGVLLGNLFIVFGGTYFKDKFQYLNDLWVIDTDAMEWHKPKAAGKAPSPRYGHAAAVVGTSVYVFGGSGPSGAIHNDLHRLDVVRWTWSLVPSTTAPPLGRFGHTLAAVGDKLVMFGGWDGSSAFNDLWVFDTASSSWIKPAVDGPPPCARHGHSMVLAPATNRLVVWGGWATSAKGIPDYRADARELDTDSMSWVRPRITGERPTGRYWHCAGMVSDRFMLVAGGWGANENAESAKEAEQASAAAAAGLSRSASLAAAAAASTVAGPRRSRGLWLLDTVEGEWLQPEAVGRHPGLRYGQCVAVLGPYVLLFGGWDGVKSRADIAQLDLSALVGDAGAEAEAEADAETETEAEAEANMGRFAGLNGAGSASGGAGGEGSGADSMVAGLSAAGSGVAYERAQ